MGAGDVKLALGVGALDGDFGVDVWVLAALGRAAADRAVGRSCWSVVAPRRCRTARRCAWPRGAVAGLALAVAASGRGRAPHRARCWPSHGSRSASARAVHGKMGRVLRWTTAGESHGRALVSMLEGMVAGVDDHVRRHRRPTGAPPARLRPRRPDEVRGRRGHRAGRGAPRRHARRPDRRRDRQHRVAQVGDRDGHRPGRPGRTGRRRPQRAADPAAARSRRLRGHAQVRLRRRPARAGARQRPRDRGAGRGGHHRAGVPAPGARGRGALARHLDRRVRRRTTARRRSRPTWPRSTTARCAPSTRRPSSR